MRISACFRFVDLCCSAAAARHTAVPKHQCVHISLSTGKAYFHAGPVLIRDTGAATEARFAKTNLLRDMARSFRSNFPLAFLQGLRPSRDGGK
jgi:hypothetical protein